MRTPGAGRAKLQWTDDERARFQSTEVAHVASLVGTDMRFQSAFCVASCMHGAVEHVGAVGRSPYWHFVQIPTAGSQDER